MPSVTRNHRSAIFPPRRPAERAGRSSTCASMTTIAPIRACCRVPCAAITAPSATGRRTIGARASSSSAREGKSSAKGAAAWLRHEGIDAQTLEGGFEAWKKAGELLVRTDKLPPRDDKGRTVWVTRSAAQGRPHRLSLADPPLHRSQRGVSVRHAVGGDGRRRALQRHAVRHRGRVLEPSRRDLHLRHDDRGVRAQDRTAAAVWPRSCAAPTPPASTSRRRRLGCSPPRSATRACIATISRSSRRRWLLYDAFYRWCRDATEETHNWPSDKPGA